VQTGKDSRRAAVAEAEIIIDAGVQNFMHWLQQRGTVPLIQQINAQADAWRATEIGRAKNLLA
jgi:glutamyl-tRNA reductase